MDFEISDLEHSIVVLQNRQQELLDYMRRINEEIAALSRGMIALRSVIETKSVINAIKN